MPSAITITHTHGESIAGSHFNDARVSNNSEQNAKGAKQGEERKREMEEDESTKNPDRKDPRGGQEKNGVEGHEVRPTKWFTFVLHSKKKKRI